MKAYVAPRVGAWIEISASSACSVNGISSHPVWVRGLKYTALGCGSLRNSVAPRVGAWIEIALMKRCLKWQPSRTPCGCVD